MSIKTYAVLDMEDGIVLGLTTFDRTEAGRKAAWKLFMKLARKVHADDKAEGYKGMFADVTGGIWDQINIAVYASQISSRVVRFYPSDH